MRSLKTYLRNKLIACGACYQAYTNLKYRIISLFELSYFFYDISGALRHMDWRDSRHISPAQLQAKLLFYYHKIEKGLCMPGKKRLFALTVIPEVTKLLNTWEATGQPINDPVYIGAINSLRAYCRFLQTANLDAKGAIGPLTEDFLLKRTSVSDHSFTPITVKKAQIAELPSYDSFRLLCDVRRTFRNFSEDPVPDNLIRQAVEAAQLSPSACNRQPCRVYSISDKQVQQALLSHQNGNAGFGHLAPIVLVLTSDESHCFGAIERHQPYVDGGLFAMSLIYALQVQRLVSCCLNWCVTPMIDRQVHRLMNISSSERIVMLILTGYPVDETAVPRSQRKSLDRVLAFR